MIRAIKYELKPNRQQKELINKTCGCCRFVYNYMLDKKIKAYQENKRNISSYDLIKELVALKEECTFLKEIPSQALQQSILNMDFAYKLFFKKNNGFPKFKKKGINDSYRIPIACDIDFDNWKVKIAKIGKVKIYRGHNKKIEGHIKSYTIKHTTTDRYFISIIYECEDIQKLYNNTSVGIDLGIKTFATLSDGKIFENQKYLEQNLKKLRVLQRKASRQYKQNSQNQSNNWKKTMKQIAKLHEHIKFQRQDYLHKISRYIADNYSTVFIEDLNIKEMEQDKKLSRYIGACGWNMFINLLKYKCTDVINVDRYFASSQICNVCGYKNSKVKNLSIRTWICPKCNTKHNRDLNASINIKREGLSLCALNKPMGLFAQNHTISMV